MNGRGAELWTPWAPASTQEQMPVRLAPCMLIRWLHRPAVQWTPFGGQAAARDKLLPAHTHLKKNCRVGWLGRLGGELPPADGGGSELRRSTTQLSAVKAPRGCPRGCSQGSSSVSASACCRALCWCCCPCRVSRRAHRPTSPTHDMRWCCRPSPYGRAGLQPLHRAPRAGGRAAARAAEPRGARSTCGPAVHGAHDSAPAAQAGGGPHGAGATGLWLSLICLYRTWRVCVCVCVHTCVFACACACASVCGVCLYMHLRVCVCVCVCVCMRRHACVYRCACVCAPSCSCTCTRNILVCQKVDVHVCLC